MMRSYIANHKMIIYSTKYTVFVLELAFANFYR